MIHKHTLLLTVLFALGLGWGGCTFDSSGVVKPADCGDGVLGPTEQCDGMNLGGATCGTLGLGQGILSCQLDCTFNVTQCDGSAGDCGNGVVDGAEQCDDGNLDACDGCSPQCITEACGNGLVECGEQCDDGNLSPGDGCDAQCHHEGTQQCGDGVLQAGEVCEPGLISTTCQDHGFVGGILGCAADCHSYDTSACTRGDGEACIKDAQCDGGTCYTEADDGWPGGFCTRACSGGTGCGTGEVCIDLGTSERCYVLCSTTAQCRTGYFCREDPFQQQSDVCRPHCETHADCPDGGTCDPYTGLCDGPPDPGDSDNGAACGYGYPSCKGACWGQPQDGYCLSACALSTGVCPGDGVCTDFGDGADLGYCLDGCSGGGDCSRAGYDCSANPYGSGTVCWQI